jgi:homoserine kinase
MPSTVTVTVPATTANLGPGFDCIGAALSLYNQFEFTILPPLSEKQLVIEATGTEASRVATDESNLAYQAFAKFYRQLQMAPPPLHLAIHLDVPLARGLGSSATAIVAGLVGANALAGSPLSLQAVLHLAIAIEGHPDNVAPALMGGCRLSTSGTNDAWTICDVSWHRDVIPIAAIPNFELSTAEARRVLPANYSRADAIFNMAHLGLLLRGLETGRADWLQAALKDRIHQPYRQQLIRGFEFVEAAALEAGAYGLVISGAGPTLLSLTHPDRTTDVERAIATAWTKQGVAVEVKVLQLDSRGAAIEGLKLEG